MYNSDYFQNQNETNISGDYNTVNQTNDIDVNMTMPNTSCPRERVVHRTFVHDVPQDFPFMIEK